MKKVILSLCAAVLCSAAMSAQEVRVSKSDQNGAPTSIRIQEPQNDEGTLGTIKYYSESKGKKNKSKDGQFPFVELGFNFLTPVDYGWNTEIPNFMDINKAHPKKYGGNRFRSDDKLYL